MNSTKRGNDMTTTKPATPLQVTVKFERAWGKYIAALKRLDERHSNWQRTDRARYGARIARANLRDMCLSFGIEIPTCAR